MDTLHHINRLYKSPHTPTTRSGKNNTRSLRCCRDFVVFSRNRHEGQDLEHDVRPQLCRDVWRNGSKPREENSRSRERKGERGETSHRVYLLDTLTNWSQNGCEWLEKTGHGKKNESEPRSKVLRLFFIYEIYLLRARPSFSALRLNRRGGVIKYFLSYRRGRMQGLLPQRPRTRC